MRSALWALARDAGISEEECAKAVKVLESPDSDSACKDNEGRRIQVVDGGWLVLNHDLWRDRINRANRLSAQAAWQKEYRKRKGRRVREAACEGAQTAINEALDSAKEQI